MKIYLLVALLSLMAFSAHSESGGLDVDTPELSRLLNPGNADRILMVGFPDQSINRVDITLASTTYRRRGSYQSSTWSRRITTQIAEDYHLKKLTEWPMTEVSVHCAVYQVPSSESVADIIARLAKDTRVSIVQPMHLYNTQAEQKNDPYYKLQLNLRYMEINQAHGIATGKNITIAMIDTGVDLKHPDLIGQISRNENFAADISPDFSNDKHGTAVAGVMVARKDNGIGITGVAPDAKLIAFKACWPNQTDSIDAVCNSFTLALAVNSAIKSGAKILNMSLTGPQDPLLELLLNKAVEKGMIIVAANSKQDQANGNFPASLVNVISVQSALTETDANHLILDKKISAPGEKILTTLPHGTYDFISGSSISAAEVSGIIALLMEIKTNLTLAETKLILQKSQLLSKNSPFPIINANSAVLALCETASCPEQKFSVAKKNSSNKMGPSVQITLY